MIAAWMAYAFLVGTFAAGAAWILEALLRSHRCPARWVWLGGMALAGAWPVASALRTEAGGMAPAPPPGPAFVALEPLTFQVGTRSVWMLLDQPLLVFWILSSSTLLGLGLLLIFRTRMLRKRWRGEEAGGRKVLVSEDWGPAVVGLMNPQIVLPGWCRSLGEEALQLILDHEAEHLEAGDLRLLSLAGVFPILFPWSVPAWWMWHRLRLAVEGDCDLRVLKRNPRATRAYLELLLDVGRRLPRGRVAAAMLSEPERTLARRIRTMTMPVPRKPLLRGLLLVVIGGILIAVACAVPTPSAVDEDAQLPAARAVAEKASPALSEVAGQLMEAPTPTPFTDPPVLRNREEVSAALESEYPPLLKEAGIGGTVNVWLFIDEEGIPRRTLVQEASGHRALDEAALRVAEVIRFSPAKDGAEPVQVWISLPITFTVSAPDERVVEEPGDADGDQVVGVIQNAENPIPVTRDPSLLNGPEVQEAVERLRGMVRAYPEHMREDGATGVVDLWFYLDEEGTVVRTMVNQTSGYRDLDDAALRLASLVRFSPAMNGDTTVPVWISFPVRLHTGTDGALPPPPLGSRPLSPSSSGSEGRDARSRTDPDPVAAEMPPDAPDAGDVGESPTYTPFTVRPDITNRATVARALETEYPPLVRDAGIGGTAVVWFFIDETGATRRVLLRESSGHKALDDAALRVAEQVEFTPALDGEEPVPVWIALPITFSVR